MIKDHQYRIRLTENEHAELYALSNDLGISMADVLRYGLYLVKIREEAIECNKEERNERYD